MTSGVFQVATSRQRELIDITKNVEVIVKEAKITSGVLYLFNPHTTAGLTINEGADPDVRHDIIQGLNNIVPENLDYLHMEGNSPAHIMALLTGSSLNIIIADQRLILGTWQKIFFCEFDGPRNRSIHWKCIADQ
jgi:secondary thiamine-phosphate synthase enzyme